MLMALLPLAGWADIVVTVNTATKTYGSDDPTPTKQTSMFSIISGSASKTDVAPTLSLVRIQSGEDVNAEGYTFRLQWSGAKVGGEDVVINGTGQGVLYINQKSIDDASVTIAAIPTQIYTGAAIVLESISVSDSETDKDLEKGTDYTLSYANNTDKGVNTATVTLTGSGNYTGSTSKNFTIGDDITNYLVKVTQNVTLTYDGTDQTLDASDVVEVKKNEEATALTEGTDYSATFTYENNKNAGENTAIVKIEGIGAYAGTATGKFTIGRKDVTIVVADKTKKYGDADPEFTATVTGTVGGEELDYTITRTNSDVEDRDTYPGVLVANLTADADVNKNYNVTTNTPGELKITARSITTSMVSIEFDPATSEYDGTEQSPEYTLTYTAPAFAEPIVLEEGEDKDYTVAITGDKENPGDLTYTFTGKGNFYNTRNETYTIGKRNTTVTVDGNLEIGVGAEPQFTATYSPAIVEKDKDDIGTVSYVIKKDGTVVAPADLTIGTYTVEASGLSHSNYVFTYPTSTLTVTEGVVTAKVANQTIDYGATFTAATIEHADGLAVSKVAAFNAGVDASGLTYKCYDSEDNEVDDFTTEILPAGTYKVVASGTAVYTGYNVILTEGTFTVNQKKISTVTTALAATYAGEAKLPTATLTNGSLELVQPDAENEIAGDFTLELVTTEAELAEGLYGYNPENDYTIDNLNAGSNGYVWIKAVEGGNYTGSLVKNFTIAQAPLEVKADAKSWVYGTEEPKYTATVTGLVGKDAELDLTQEQDGFTGTVKVKRVCATTMGVYPEGLVPDDTKGLTAADNYSINNLPNQLTITEGMLYLKVKDVENEYGDAFVPASQGELELAAEGNDDLTDLVKANWKSYIDESAATYTVEAGDYIVNGPKYKISVTGVTSTNYTLTIDDGEFSVKAREIEVTAENQSVNLKLDEEFNEDVILGTTVTITGGSLVVPDEIGDIIEKLTSGTNIGDNDINIVVKENANYHVTPVKGTLTITGQDVIVLGKDAENDEQTIKDYAASPYPVQVKLNFANRNDQSLGGVDRVWGAESWNAMVLPFNITVAELSSVLGYAIVNVYDGAVKDENDKITVNFKLTMKGGNGETDFLPANKPFVVKTTDAIDPDKDYDFGIRKVVAPADEAALTVEAADGKSTFIGSYQTKTIDKADGGNLWFLLGNYGKWAYIKTSSKAKWDIVPFAAYIDLAGLSAGSARGVTFNMQELDGVSSIKGVDVENLTNAASMEGWYTVDGMKLNAAPTQKGIYIQNGKKVVVK